MAKYVYERLQNQQVVYMLRLLAAVVLVSMLLFAFWQRTGAPAFSAPSARANVEGAWEKANDVGVYAYRTDVEQITRPLPKLVNVGLSSTKNNFYVEGTVNVPEDALQMKIWAREGNVLGTENSLEIKVADGQALGRVDQGEWETVDDVSDFFAPGGDPLGFLNAAINIEYLGTERKELPWLANNPDGDTEFRYERYRFELDGLAYAKYMRDKMQDDLQNKGELPPGMQVDVIRQYIDMTGEGEIWIDEQGLPLRQTLNLRLPPGVNEQIEANIKTDFHSWAPVDQQMNGLSSLASNVGTLIFGRNGAQDASAVSADLKHFIGSLTSLASQLSLWIMASIIIGAFFILIIRSWNSPKLYSGLALTILVSMLFTPLLQNHQVAAFYERNNVRQTEQERQTEASDALREFELAPHQSSWNPQIDPLATNATGNAAPINDTDTDNDGIPDVIETELGSNPFNPDTDGDTLSDGVEVYQLSTDPLTQDSDGDGLSDNIEVQGFRSRDGLRWYLNPLDLDTNRDGQADGIECPTGYGCPDTDGDGTPNAFDYDDDNDGVPDNIDVSVTSFIRSGNQENYQIQIDNLTAGKIAFADFQFRPTDETHLWYAMNVLDWPAKDFEGQVQSHFENTAFGASGKEANGDMKLVPMLEIEIPYQAGHYGNLPVKAGAPAIGPATPVSAWLDTDKTNAYGISVKKKDNDGTLLVYVPVNVVRDPVGDGVVAFSARMAYWPASNNFGKTHTVRLAWLVRALITNPQTKTSSEQTIHTYYDTWYISGLAIREDLGVSTGIVFENPDFNGKNPNFEENLWSLADGLGQTFIAGRSNNAGQRDLTVAAIKARFDKDSNAGVPDAARWGIPNQALQVRTFDFDDQSGLATLPSGQTQSLLDQYFSEKATDATLLFVREERFRAANLEQGGGVVNQTNNQIIVNLDPNLVKQQVLAGMNWAPYRYKGANVWEAYPIAEYWQTIDERYENLFPVQAGKEDVQSGQVVVAQSYYLSLFQGVTAVVENGGLALQSPERATDAGLQVNYAPGKTAGSVVKKVTDSALRGIAREEIVQSFNRIDPLTRKETFYASLAGVRDGFKEQISDGLGKLQKLGDDLRKLDTKAVGLVSAGTIAGIGVLVSLTTLTATGVIGLDRAMAITTSGISVALAAYTLYDAYTKVGKAVSDVVAKAGRTAGIIGLVVATGIQVGLFLFSVISGGFSFGSEAFNQALAALAATIIYAVLTFAIAAIPIVGQVIVAVLALIDAVILAVCAIIGATGRFCQGIAGNVIAALTSFFYSSKPAVDLQHKDRLAMSNLDINPKDPTKGYAVDNDLEVSIDVRSQLFVQGRSSDALVSNMRYRIQTNKAEFHQNLQKTQMYPQWIEIPVNRTGATSFSALIELSKGPRYYVNVRPTGSVPVRVAGINQRLNDVWLAEAYAVDVQKRCLGFRCGSSTDRGTNHFKLSPSGGLKFDVFPRTFKGFYNLESRGQGSWAMAWNDVNDQTRSLYNLAPNLCDNSGNYAYCPSGVAFPTLADADGDGLRSRAAFGNDPDDSKADVDGDGLSDFYERENGLNPALADSDNDGLLDYEEVRRGTDPLRTDSDGDGLTDKQEIDGWSFTYAAGRVTMVNSDPTTADTDGDGSNDRVERDQATNPRSTGSGGSFGVTGLIANRVFVAPGQAFEFTAALENNYSFDTVLFGQLDVQFSPSNDFYPPQDFYLGFGQSQNFRGSFTVSSDIAQSQVVDLSAIASSNLDAQLGNPGATITKLTIDADKPNINLSNSNVFYRPQDLVLAFEASDPTSAVISAEVSLDNGASWQAASNEGQLWFFTLPASNQNSIIQLRARDVVGNVSDVTQATLTVDGTAPTGSVNIPGSILTPQQGNTIYLTGAQDDAGQSGVASGSLRLLDSSGEAISDPQDCCGGNDSTWESAFVLPGNIQGAYTPELTLVDALGNSATYTANQTIQIDSQAPIPDVTLISVADNKLEGSVFDIGVPTNPSVVFHFEPGSTGNTFRDSSSNRWEASCGPACPSQVPGKLGGGLNFASSQQALLRVPHNPRLNKNYSLTIAAWVFMSDTNTDQKIVGKSDLSGGYVMGVRNGNLVPEIWDLEGIRAGVWGSVPTQQWVHLAMTYAVNGDLIGYINGVEVGRTAAGTTPIRPNTNPLRIGSAPWDENGLLFKGNLDELLIYDRPLAASEIATLAEDNPTSTGLGELYISLQNAADSPTSTESRPGGGVQYSMPFNETLGGSSGIANITGGNGAFCYTSPASGITCPDTVPGILGNAFEFDGVNNSIQVPSTSSSNWQFNHTAHTLAYWFKTDCANCGLSSFIDDYTFNNAPGQGVGGNDRHIYLNNGNLCTRVWSEETICTTGINYADNTWHHIAHTFGGPSGGQRIYVDGVEQASGSKSFSNFDWADAIRFGFSADAAQDHFRGSLDEVHYYHRALSADEVKELYGPTYKDQPIMKLAFEEQTGTTTGGNTRAFFDITGGQNAFCQGAACPTQGETGKFGRAVSFDGNPGKAITLGNVEDLSLADQSFTAMAWVRLDSVSGENAIFGTDTNAYNQGLHLNTRNNKAYFGFYANDTIGQTSLQAGQWYHLAWRYDHQKRTQSIFVNGNLDATGNSKLPFIGSGNVYLGRALARFGFRGLIDEAAIYNRALENEEITFLANPNRWQSISYNTSDSVFGTWSIPFPDGLEGIYDLQIRAVDQAGQVQETPDIWRGEIDNLAPRLVRAPYTGFNLLLPFTNRALFTSIYWVEDFNLKLERYQTFDYYGGYVGNRTMSARETVNGRATAAEVRLHAAPIPNFTTEFIGSSNVPKGTVPGSVVCDTLGNCSEPINLDNCTFPFNFPPGFRFFTSQSMRCDLAPAARTANGLSLDLTQSRLTRQTTPTATLSFPPTLNGTTPLTIDTFVRSLLYVRALTVTVDGAAIDTRLWAANSVTQTATTTTWLPPAEGVYTIAATLEDWSGATVDAVSGTVTVDTTPPSLTISTGLITPGNLNKDGFATITGTVSDTLGIQAMQARVNVRDWQSIPVPILTNTWQAEIATDVTEEVENLTLTMTVRAYNQAGGVVTATRIMTVNTLVPSPFTITAAYQGGTMPITAGMTIYDILSPTVILSWSPAFTFDNVALYRAGWSTARELSEQQIAALTVYGPNDLSHSETLTDGQRLYAHVIAETASGARHIESFQQPLYLDHQLTPTYINFNDLGGPYRGWINNTCSLLGVDNRLNRNAEGVETNGIPQQFYTTWDESGLQMTWTGADWSSEGDLFIYLDTQTGGSIRAYNPYPASQNNTRILLPVQGDAATQNRQDVPPRLARIEATPDQMAADYVVWVQEQTTVITQSGLTTGTLSLTGTGVLTDNIVSTTETYTASLLAWDEGSASWQTVGGNWQYNFEFVDGLPITDIYVPFNLLKITNPATASLSLVALASENDALRLWATMPNRNPVNSQRVVDVTVDQPLQRFALTERYNWSSLGNEVCVNVVQDQAGQPRMSTDRNNGVVQYNGADIKVSLTADPVGIAYSVLNDDYYFIQEDLEQFSSLVDWNAELQALCAINPDDPECDRPVASDSDIDFDASSTLGNIVDVDHPLLGDGQVIEYTLQLSNDGLGASTGLVVDMDTWGPLVLPDGDYYSDEVEGEFWEWYNLVLDDLGDLGPGEVLTITFTGIVEVGFDENNNEGFATLDMTVYDDTGDYFTNNIDWLYMDHPVDDAAPAYLEIQSHLGLIGPDETTFTGFVLDYSPVPTITLRITDPTEQTNLHTCLDATPEDGIWSCLWDAGGAANGEIYRIDAEPIDIFGQVGDWSEEYNVFYNFMVDAISPVITAGNNMQSAFGDGLIGPGDTLLSGQVSDNHLVSQVEVCNATSAGENCELASLAFDSDVAVQQTYVYTDAPTNPIPINAANACEGGSSISRTFTVPDSFVVADVDFGLNLDHEYRHDLIATLISPAGTEVILVSDNYEADNYDVLLNDAVTLLVADDELNHDTQPPYYENERSSYDYLSEFNNEAAQGTWTLEICDYFPEEDDGAYNRSQLILRSKTIPVDTSAQWSYNLAVEEDADAPDSIYNLRIYGLDSVGNRSTAPISLSYQIDTTAPVITVTNQANRFSNQANTPVLAGTVSDKSNLARLELTTLTPNNAVLSETLSLVSSAWSITTQTNTFALSGTYRIWIEAEDVAGNRSTVGPFEVQTNGFTGITTMYLPLVLR